MKEMAEVFLVVADKKVLKRPITPPRTKQILDWYPRSCERDRVLDIASLNAVHQSKAIGNLTLSRKKTPLRTEIIDQYLQKHSDTELRWSHVL